MLLSFSPGFLPPLLNLSFRVKMKQARECGNLSRSVVCISLSLWCGTHMFRTNIQWNKKCELKRTGTSVNIKFVFIFRFTVSLSMSTFVYVYINYTFVYVLNGNHVVKVQYFNLNMLTDLIAVVRFVSFEIIYIR